VVVDAKQHVISFKADQALIAALDDVSNRSAFIRNAILAALDGTCPLCRGTGVMNPRQRRHWEEFSRTHQVERCTDCDESRLVCCLEKAEEPRP
jgi:hypothetical protein